MQRRIKPKDLETILRESFLEETMPQRGGGPAVVATVQRRGRDAVLDSDDAEIIVYELFGERA